MPRSSSYYKLLFRINKYRITFSSNLEEQEAKIVIISIIQGKDIL